MADTATLVVDGKSIELPVVEGSEGERAVDIRKLRSETGIITLDPGFANSGACRSAITFIDGEKGILRYRGIPIEELAEHSSFLEVAYLLIYGQLPSGSEFDSFAGSITSHTMLHEDFKRFRRTRIRWRPAPPRSAPSPPSTRTPSTRGIRARSRSRSTA